MKKKIVAGLVTLLAVFLVGGAYVVVTIETGASRLDELVRLHQVELLREKYLIQIKRVQSDLALRNTRYSRTFDTVVTDVVNMGRVVDTCFKCHHSTAGESRLRELKDETEKYEEALSRVLTIRSNAARLEEEEDNAFRRGEGLTAKVKDMIALTSGRLAEKTQVSLGMIRRSRYVLYALFGISPLLAAAMAYAFLRRFDVSVRTLRDAADRLRDGDLGHRVDGLADEFGEIAASFNRMAESLEEQLRAVRRTEQTATVADLAAGLAEEFRTPLEGVKAAMADLSRDPNLAAENRDRVQRAVEEVGWLEALIRSYLNFARPQKAARTQLNLNGVVETTLSFCMRHRFPATPARERIRIVKEFSPVPPTTADPVALQQVFLTLFLRGIDAMPDGGVLGVRTSLDEGGKTIRVDISDTGRRSGDASAGESLRRDSAKGPEGSGSALSMTKLLIEKQGGTLGAVNVPGGGMVFTLRLPVRPPDGDGIA